MIKVVKYGTPWCGPCIAMGNVLEMAKKDYPQIVFESVDVSVPENECLIDTLKILAVPTLICYVDDEIVSKTTGGPMAYPALRKLLDSLLTYKDKCETKRKEKDE